MEGGWSGVYTDMAIKCREPSLTYTPHNARSLLIDINECAVPQPANYEVVREHLSRLKAMFPNLSINYTASGL